MKKRNRLLRFADSKKKNKEKNKHEFKNKNLSVYSYKCGHKNIKLTVQKIESFRAPAALDSIFYYNCIFCGKDFDQTIQTCPDCNQPLVKIRLKKCPQCGAKNSPLKQKCWVCNALFPVLNLDPEKETQLLLTLNVDGSTYRNTDQSLGLGMRKLFEDLIASGFSKEPLDAWLKIHEDDIAFKKDLLKEECKYLAQESRRKLVIYAGIFILAVIISLLFVKMFWSG
jgi:hypothetical protein